MTKYVNITDAAEYIWKEIDDWRGGVMIKLEDACDVSIKEARKQIKELSKGTYKPSNKKKHYVNLFRTKKTGDFSRVLRNTKYQLSHLLEDGHEVKNQYGGPYKINKRTAGVGSNISNNMLTSNYKMWENTEEYLEKYFYEEVKKRL